MQFQTIIRHIETKWRTFRNLILTAWLVTFSPYNKKSERFYFKVLSVKTTMRLFYIVFHYLK